MLMNSKIFISGADSLVGISLIKQLKSQGYTHIIETAEPRYENAEDVVRFFAIEKPEYVFVLGGKCGGISMNQKQPAELIYDNITIATNVIHQAHQHNVKKLLYLASACVYPKLSPQPMAIDSLMSGPLEVTNEAYATAKIAGMALCRAYRQQYKDNFISAIPANIFGPSDDFDPDNAHVIAALLARLHAAKQQNTNEIMIWGSGSPRREFVYVDDIADGCIFLMQHYDDLLPMNIGGGVDISIRELAILIKDIVGYQGNLKFDITKPDGMPLKSLDAAPLLAMGWQPQFLFEPALKLTYDWYIKQHITAH
jgi:GDP-L-fucose synthase